MADNSQQSVLLEQYKSYVADLGNIGSRYATANGFYLSIISALIAFIALTKKGESFETLRTAIQILVPLFAVLLCGVWFLTMRVYSSVFRAKFSVLRAMEVRLAFPTYESEDKKLREYGPRLISIERWVPLILSLPFLVVLGHGVWLWARAKLA